MAILAIGGHLALVPVWLLPSLIFPVALAVALRASARFTLLLEDLGKHWRVSPGLLSFASALGANIPNYVASLAAFASGQGQIGLGIIVGSNIFNLAVILGLVTFARQGRQGITLTAASMHDARRVAALAAAMGVTTLLTYLALTPPFVALPLPLPTAAVPVLSAVTVGIFVVLVAHAFQRLSHRPHYYHAPSEPRGGPHYPVGRAVAGIIVALAMALGGVIVMVVSGQAVAADVHLSPVIFSLVILAVATSLPNAIVAYELARTERASTVVEEIASSNAINVALGSALPLLLWHIRLTAPVPLRLDVALLCMLGVAVVAQVQARRIPRMVGASLLGVYALWVLTHVLAGG
jgi:cation:H+ antiporter